MRAERNFAEIIIYKLFHNKIKYNYVNDTPLYLQQSTFLLFVFNILCEGH